LSTDRSHIDHLAGLLRGMPENGAAPVERWDPPCCGDIGLAIAADGTWSYRGSPIARTALVKLFARVLRRDGDGRTYLVTPAEKVEVAVADAPFLAVEMMVSGSGPGQAITLRSNVDDVVPLGPDHPLRVAADATGGVKPYVLVRGRLEALLTRALTYDLIELAIPDPHSARGPLGVWSRGCFFPLE
jgi:hypothetical protein